jgi:hypothetical protein
LDYQYTLKNGQEGKTGLFLRWVTVGQGGHKVRVNEGGYGGNILY